MLKSALILIGLACQWICLAKGQSPCKIIGSRRSCTKTCTSKSDCPADSDCLCDGRCGKGCVKRGLTCKKPPTVRNAQYTTTGMTFNSIATYTCNDGYTLNGAAKKRCTAKGKWDGVGPTCMQACKIPELPFGAYIKSQIKSAYKTGDRITLGCKKGFKKKGSDMRICISGKWTSFLFKCVGTSCPRTIRAARIKCTKKCSPKGVSGCDKGQKCLCDGHCGYSCVETDLSCGDPPSISFGFKQFTSTVYNSTVSYRCRKGYTLNDNTPKRCTAKKRWERPTPSCLLDCPDPYVPPNAFVENKKKKYASGDRVTFKCKKGYKRNGIPSTLCFIGRWNIIPFKCEKKGCSAPGVPENGNIVGISYVSNSKIFFSCNLGYILIGSKQRICLDNSTWSGTQPICKVVDCGKVQQPRNGSISGSETTFQKSVIYSCDKGFDLKGPKSIICQSDGQWSSTSSCEAVDCGLPDDPVHGTKKGDITTYTNTIEYFCNPGYQLIGSHKRTCLHTARWSGTQPICKGRRQSSTKLNCTAPNGLSIGVYIKSIIKPSYKTLDKVELGCKKGFTRFGNPKKICINGSWIGFGPFVCLRPFYKICVPGMWIGFPFICQALPCSQPLIPENAYIVNNSQPNYYSGNRITFKCKRGYYEDGIPKAYCFMGHWKYSQFQCKIVDCGKVKAPRHGSISGNETTFQKTISYSCVKGFKLKGPRVITCQASGQWSSTSTSCEALPPM